MYLSSLGDLAQSYSMQSRNTAIKESIARLTTEIASGQVADVRTAVGGNVAYANDLNRSLTKLDAYDLATLEATHLASGAQSALGRISDLTGSLRDSLLGVGASPLSSTTTTVVKQAKDSFESAVYALNTSVAGRTIFGGTATNTQPIAPPDDLLSDLSTAIAGAGSVDDILAAAEAWFDDPTGFAISGYQGSTTSMAPVSISDEDSANFTLRADDPILRDALRTLAVVALADDPTLGLTDAQQSELLQKSTNGVLSSNNAIVELQAQVGLSEGQLEALTVRHSSERSSLEIARSDLLSVDPYQAATELEQVQFQLQSLYAITSRMSQLSLVNFL